VFSLINIIWGGGGVFPHAEVFFKAHACVASFPFTSPPTSDIQTITNNRRSYSNPELLNASASTTCNKTMSV